MITRPLLQIQFCFMQGDSIQPVLFDYLVYFYTRTFNLVIDLCLAPCILVSIVLSTH